MAKIIPLLLIVFGMLAGGGAGILLRPVPQDDAVCAGELHLPECEEVEIDEVADVTDQKVDPAAVQYVKLNNQFVVPVVKDGSVTSLVVMSLSIETIPSMTDTVFKLEPKLRDAFLQVMFLHANSGGFEGQFTSGETMKDLKGSLFEAAREILGDAITNVLITDILRQDV